MNSAQSIYIHIPFCKTKCPYCDFASWARKEQLIEKYFDSLIREIKVKCEAYRDLRTGDGATGRFAGSPIRSIFFGGGTPSLIHPDLYEKLFNELKKYFEITTDCEITLELNPGTARDDYLIGYKELGINRISVGAQSFNEKVLDTLGRRHTVSDTTCTIEKVKQAGFTNFNLDLIYSVPGMTKEVWMDTIYLALKFEPKHISAYSLIIEPNTPFEFIYKDPASLPLDDFTFELYFKLCNILRSAGFLHYEVSNFAKEGYECKHNLCYWSGDEYFAFGVSAHRYVNGLRTSNTRDLEAYIVNPYSEKIIDFPVNYNFEKVMLTSRLNKGFNISLVKKMSKKNPEEITNLLKDLSCEGFLELSGDKVHLTDKGMFVNNEILLKLM